MPQFILKIDLGNDAMVNERDISEAVQTVSKEVYDLGVLYHQTYPIKDRNGNVVGHYEVRDS